jgi:hypothetical protein
VDVVFRIRDRCQKRWFPKVAEAAAQKVSALTQNCTFELQEILAAEFSLNDGESTFVTRKQTSHQKLAVITFVATSWQTIDSSINDATVQLASALLRIVPRERMAELSRLFLNEGIVLRPVSVSHENTAIDHRDYFVIYVDASGFQTSDLMRFDEELDAMLRQAGCGEVDGSGSGITGYNLDVSLQRRDIGLRIVFDFLKSNDLEDHSRVEDSRNGERVFAEQLK